MSSASPPLQSLAPAICKRWDLVALVALLVAVALRCHGLGMESFWFDEESSRHVASASTLNGLMQAVVQEERSPPLYFLMLWAWMHLVGDSDVAIRALSVLLGLATIPVLWYTFRRFAGHAAGALCALLVALSPTHLYWCQEARPYVLLGLLGATLLLLALRCSEQRCPPVIWAAFGVVAALMVYTHYSGVVFAGSMFVVLGVMKTRQRAWRELIAVLAVLFIVAACYAPWFVGFRHQLARGLTPHLRLSVTPSSLATVLWGAMAPPGHFPSHVLQVVWGIPSAIMFALYLQGLRAFRGAKTPYALPIAAFSLMPVGLMALLSLLSGELWVTKIFVPAGLCSVGVAAVGVSSLRRRALAIVIVGLLLAYGLCGIWIEKTSAQKEQWREVASYLAAQSAKGDPVLVTNDSALLPLTHYYAGPRLRFVGVSRDIKLPGELRPLVAPLLWPGQKLWLIESHQTPYLSEYLHSLPYLKTVSQQRWVGIRTTLFRAEKQPDRPGGAKTP